MTEYEILMGTTINGSIVFAGIELGNDIHKNFAVSFKEVVPFIATDKFLHERAENMIDSLDKETLEYYLSYYDCKLSGLADNLAMDTIETIVDISLFSDSFSIEGIENDIYFESVACGQHDTRLELIAIDPQFSDWLHNMWDKYHLKELPEYVKAHAKKTIEAYIESVGDEEEWIQTWLKELYTND